MSHEDSEQEDNVSKHSNKERIDVLETTIQRMLIAMETIAGTKRSNDNEATDASSLEHTSKRTDVKTTPKKSPPLEKATAFQNP